MAKLSRQQQRERNINPSAYDDRKFEFGDTLGAAETRLFKLLNVRHENESSSEGYTLVRNNDGRQILLHYSPAAFLEKHLYDYARRSFWKRTIPILLQAPIFSHNLSGIRDKIQAFRDQLLTESYMNPEHGAYRPDRLYQKRYSSSEALNADFQRLFGSLDEDIFEQAPLRNLVDRWVATATPLLNAYDVTVSNIVDTNILYDLAAGVPIKDQIIFVSEEGRRGGAEMFKEVFTSFINRAGGHADDALIEQGANIVFGKIIAGDQFIQNDRLEATRQYSEAQAALPIDQAFKGVQYTKAGSGSQAMEKTRLEHAAEQARLRAQREQEAQEQFMRDPRPYVITGAAEKLLQTMRSYGESLAGNAANARNILEAVETVSGQMDRRFEGDALGAILFSRDNLMALIGQAGLAGNLGGGGREESSGLTPAQNTARLRASCAASEAIRDRVNALMEDECGLMLLAPLVLGAQRASTYRAQLNVAPVMRAMRLYEQQAVSDWPEEELQQYDESLLDGEPEWEALKSRLSKSRDVAKIRQQHQAKFAELAQVVSSAITNEEMSRRTLKSLVRKDETSEASPAAPASLMRQEWLAVLEEQDYVGKVDCRPSPDDPRSLQLYSIEFPYLFVPLPLEAKPGTFGNVLKNLREQEPYHQANIALMDELGSQCGFILNGMELTHPEYAITIALGVDQKRLTSDLMNARERFEERLSEQNTLLQRVASAGVAIARSEEDLNAGAITLSHALLGEPVTLASRGYLGSDDAEMIDTLLESIAERQAAASRAWREQQRQEVQPQRKARQLEPSRILIVVDSSTLINLANTRGDNGETWLDLLKIPADLGIKVVIPAFVAYAESCGMRPIYREDGSVMELERFDPLFTKNPEIAASAGRLERFFEQASHMKLSPNGDVLHAPGDHPGLIIADTHGDRALFDRIQRIQETTSPNFWGRRVSRELYNADHGERTINVLVRNFPGISQAYILSDDRNYLRGFAATSMGNGAPVSHVSTRVFIHALCEGGGKKISELCGPGAGSARTVIPAIETAAKRHLIRWNEPGVPQNGFSARPVLSLDRAIAAAIEHAEAQEIAPAVKGITPKSIKPDDIQITGASVTY